MKRLHRIIIAILLAATATVTYAACTRTTIIGPDGSITWCQTCCDSLGNCTVTCL